MAEDYQDGIDTNGASLKYDKTANRDLMSTIERINRSEKFKDSADRILSDFKTVLTRDAERLFKDAWRNKHESHENPPPFSLQSEVFSPNYKRTEWKDGTSKFHYILNFELCVLMKNETEMFKGDNSAMYAWFHREIAPILNRSLMTAAKNTLEKSFSNVFFYPSLETAKTDDVGGGITCADGRINLASSVNLKIVGGSELPVGYADYADVQDIRSIKVNALSIALERVIRV